MHKQANGDILFTGSEVASLARLFHCIHELFYAMPSYPGDLLGGEDEYRAFCMWEDVLAGQEHELDWYFDGEEEEEEEEETNSEPQTVAEWLALHGGPVEDEREP